MNKLQEFLKEEKTFLLFQNIIVNYKIIISELISNNSFKEYSTCKEY